MRLDVPFSQESCHSLCWPGHFSSEATLSALPGHRQREGHRFGVVHEHAFCNATGSQSLPCHDEVTVKSIDGNGIKLLLDRSGVELPNGIQRSDTLADLLVQWDLPWFAPACRLRDALQDLTIA